MSAEAVARLLVERGIAFAVIGAQAMAFRGAVRSSVDTDFFTTDRAVLTSDFWSGLANATADVRRGDFDDPLAGVVKIELENDHVDVVVGRHKWQLPVIAQAEPMRVGDMEMPVARAADLVLLKLFSMGMQDRWDIHLLLAADATIAAEVDERIHDLPEDSRELWRQLRLNDERELPSAIRDLQ